MPGRSRSSATSRSHRINGRRCRRNTSRARCRASACCCGPRLSTPRRASCSSSAAGSRSSTPAARTLRLDDGRSLRYDRLLLATGSRVRKLEVPGVVACGRAPRADHRRHRRDQRVAAAWRRDRRDRRRLHRARDGGRRAPTRVRSRRARSRRPRDGTRREPRGFGVLRARARAKPASRFTAARPCASCTARRASNRSRSRTGGASSATPRSSASASCRTWSSRRARGSSARTGSAWTSTLARRTKTSSRPATARAIRIRCTRARYGSSPCRTRSTKRK